MRAFTGRNLALVSTKALVLDPGGCCSWTKSCFAQDTSFILWPALCLKRIGRVRCRNDVKNVLELSTLLIFSYFSVNSYRNSVVETIVFGN